MITSVTGVAFEDWPEAIGWLVLAVVVVALVMARAGKAMTASGGAGIVAFELASDARKAEAVVAAWGESGRRAAMRSLLLDYLWILLYAPAIALGCLYVGAIADMLGWTTLAILGTLLAGGALLAGATDVLENSVLLSELSGRVTELKVQIARTAAVVKFGFVGACLLYVMVVRGFAWLYGA